MKKEKEILNFEIENMKEKLVQINEKTQEIKDKLKKPNNIKNYKLLDRLIEGFTENLVVYWEDVLELLIDELLVEEVKVLNKIEREKKLSLNSFDGYMEYMIQSYMNLETDHQFKMTSKQAFKMDHFKDVFQEMNTKEKTIRLKHNFL